MTPTQEKVYGLVAWAVAGLSAHEIRARLPEVDAVQVTLAIQGLLRDGVLAVAGLTLDGAELYAVRSAAA